MKKKKSLSGGAATRTELLRLGNLGLYEVNEDDMTFLVCEDAAGTWCIRWREDSETGAIIRLLACDDDETVREYLHRLLVAYYIHTTHVHDWLCMTHGGEKDENGETEYLPFLTEYWRLCERAAERELQYAEKVSPEEESQVLQEESELAEIQEAADILGVDLLKEVEDAE